MSDTIYVAPKKESKEETELREKNEREAAEKAAKEEKEKKENIQKTIIDAATMIAIAFIYYIVHINTKNISPLFQDGELKTFFVTFSLSVSIVVLVKLVIFRIIDSPPEITNAAISMFIICLIFSGSAHYTQYTKNVDQAKKLAQEQKRLKKSMPHKTDLKLILVENQYAEIARINQDGMFYYISPEGFWLTDEVGNEYYHNPSKRGEMRQFPLSEVGPGTILSIKGSKQFAMSYLIVH